MNARAVGAALFVVGHVLDLDAQEPHKAMDAGTRGASGVPSPEKFLGFRVGADRKLADWEQITGYFSALATAVSTVRVDTLGPTTGGLPLIYAAISAPGNIRDLSAIRRRQAHLADPRNLTPSEEASLVASQPAVIVIQCNIHSSEIASSQMAMELAYRLATLDTLQRQLEGVVVLLIPSANPDGEEMVTQWYRRGLNGPWEGGPLPWLYHRYVGHDNNRDWYMISQQETKLITALLYTRWYPSVFYDVHQQGSYGMRLTVPPHVDPIDPNVDPLIVRGINEIGAAMSFALESRGKSGVGDGVTYDLWWHGGARSTPTRHNAIGLLTEAASVNVASPLDIAFDQLRGHGRGLSRYERRVNFPNPWPGGTWRLRDIVDYELIAAEALVRLVSSQREEFVRNFVALAKRQVHLGETEKPFGYVIPPSQRDPAAVAKLLDVLRLGGVEIDSVGSGTTLSGRVFPAGAMLVRLDQPYRAHAKDLLEVQGFPKIEQYPGGPPERPYDIAGWTLPLQMGVQVEPLDQPFSGLPRRPTSGHPPFACGTTPDGGLDARNSDCYRVIFRRLRVGAPVRWGHARRSRLPRVALYKPWTANIDEGWTRWVFEQFGLPFHTLSDSTAKAGKLRDRFDVVVVPDMSLSEARDGQPRSAVPPRYAGGLGGTGTAALKEFVQDGGRLILLDRASEIATGVLGLQVGRITVPARIEPELSAAVPTARTGARAIPLYAPGSILRVLIDTTLSAAAGMPDTAAVYFTNSTTFEVPPGSPIRTLARYPDRVQDILMSGYLQGGEAIAGKAAAVEAQLGRGRIIMFGFRPQYRGQSWGTFRLLFNAVLDGESPAGLR
ncbi:MAG: M14 family metallopeptidase [Gemmatimonadaceae bacterium]